MSSVFGEMLRALYKQQGGFRTDENEHIIAKMVDAGWTVKYNADRSMAYIVEWE